MRYATGQVASGQWQDNRLIQSDEGTETAPDDGAAAPALPSEAAAN